jgi:hypothetical protein
MSYYSRWKNIGANNNGKGKNSYRSLNQQFLGKIEHETIDKLKDYHFENIAAITVDSSTFVHACERNRRDVVEWIMELGNIDIHYCNDTAFKRACYYGQESILLLLIGLQKKHGPFKCDHELFTLVCTRNYGSIAKILLDNFDIDYKRGKDKLFKKACQRQRMSIVKMFCDHEPTYDHIVLPDGKVKYTIKRDRSKEIDIEI